MALESAGGESADTIRRHLQLLTFSHDIAPLLAVIVHLAADLGLTEATQEISDHQVARPCAAGCSEE